MPPKKQSSVNKIWLAVGAAAGAVGLSYLAYKFFFKRTRTLEL